MSETWNDLIKILGPTLILILQGVYAWLSKKRAERLLRKQEVDDQTTKERLHEIHILVNSNLSAAMAKVAAMVAEMEQLRIIITRLTPPPESIVSLTNRVAELQTRVAIAVEQKPTA